MEIAVSGSRSEKFMDRIASLPALSAVVTSGAMAGKDRAACAFLDDQVSPLLFFQGCVGDRFSNGFLCFCEDWVYMVGTIRNACAFLDDQMHCVALISCRGTLVEDRLWASLFVCCEDCGCMSRTARTARAFLHHGDNCTSLAYYS